MSRKQKIYLIAAIVYLLALGLIIGIAFLLPFAKTQFSIFVGVLALVGLIVTVVAVIYKLKTTDGEPAEAASVDTGNLDALVRSADAHMKQAKGAAKSLSAMPLVYLLGDENSGKTETILHSGLDAELLAGQVNRDGLVPPTQLTNIWYTASAAFVEASGALLKQPDLWRRLVSVTAPGKLSAALSKGALQPTRAAVVCVSTERLLTGNTSETVRALGQAVNEQLRTLSKTLGITLPVYVLFTKLDKIPSFADFVANLTDDEIRDPLGSLLAQPDPGAGLYAESATTQISQRFDEICYTLSEFRLEVLARGGEPTALARAYEFPRELRKLRSLVVDVLVETGRPSQLGVNPFLRGFYFTGLRARIVEDNLAPAAFAAPPPAAAGDGATRVFSFKTAAPVAPAQPSRAGSRRVPQWVFLPHLFLRVFLADRGALDSSRSSTRVNVVKRILIGSVAACVLVYLGGLTVSYFNNYALESKLCDASALTMQSVGRGDPASTTDLEGLDKLRQVFVQVAAYRKDGAPLSYRWGLYPGDKLYAAACAAYGSHLRTLLLAPTQTAILNRLAALPAQRGPSDDYSATYRPLRAYLISTSNPGYSTLDFEPDALLEAWTGTRQIPSQSADLALAQFRTYSANLSEPAPCLASLGGSPQAAAVKQAQQYLSQFQGSEQVYVSMKTAANKKFPGVRFDDKFPAARPYVTDPYLVEGAFTRGGYDFMMDAIAHPEKYASGEEWVLGKSNQPTVPLSDLTSQIPARYLADFLSAWRTYLKKAQVASSGSLQDAYGKIKQLAGNQSPMLQLFQLVSQNTAVPNAAFSQPFQAPQSVVVPPGASLPVNGPYTTNLTTLADALNIYNNTPNAQSDLTASGPVLAAALNAENSVTTMSNAFVSDTEASIDKTTASLLLAPIRSVRELAKGAPAAAAGGGAKAFCDQIGVVLRKFPFNPDGHEDATLAEALSVFQPGQGAIAAYAVQSKMVNLQGNTYFPAQGGTVAPSRAFVSFLNASQTVAAALFPPGGGPPTLTFSLTQEATPNLAPAALDIDGSTLSAANQTKTFTWVSSPASKIRINAPGGGGNNSTSGPWSIFHFAYDAKHPSPNVLEEVFQNNGHVSSSDSGVPLDYRFQVSGPAAQILNPGFMKTQLHCPTKVAQ